MLNLDEIRKNIILKPGVHYFDYTASGLAYEPVEREIADALKTYANTHSDSSSSAIITQRRYEGARESGSISSLAGRARRPRLRNFRSC